jgi:hypothetical protein
MPTQQGNPRVVVAEEIQDQNAAVEAIKELSIPEANSM